MGYSHGRDPVDLVHPDYPGIPALLRESRDWQTRCIWRPHMIRRGEGRQRFARRVEQRLEAMRMREAIPSRYKSDMAYYWRTRDISYVRNVFELALAPDCELPSDISFFDPRAIALDTSPFHPDGVPCSGQYANVSYERYMHLSEQEAERHARHMRECFFPAFLAEYQSYRASVSGSVYVPLASWYYDYKVLYSFAHETSPLVAYFGRELMKADNLQLWVILLNEKLIFQAVTLVNWAPQGRLYWLPPGCISVLR